MEATEIIKPKDSSTMPLQVGVKILMQNPNGRYLFLKRNKETYPEARHWWDMPGGRIMTGSSLIENLKREVMEETGIVLDCKPKLVAAQDIIRADKHVVRLTYMGTTSSEPKLDGKEHTEFKWFSGEELEKLEGLDEYVKELVESKKI